jgi:hypothetical protein
MCGWRASSAVALIIAFSTVARSNDLALESDVQLATQVSVQSVHYCATTSEEFALVTLRVRLTNQGSGVVGLVRPAVMATWPRLTILPGTGYLHSWEPSLLSMPPPEEPDPAPDRADVALLEPGQHYVTAKTEWLPIRGPGDLVRTLPDGQAELTLLVEYFGMPSTWLGAWERVLPAGTRIATGKTNVTVRFSLRRPQTLAACP